VLSAEVAEKVIQNLMFLMFFCYKILGGGPPHISVGYL